MKRLEDLILIINHNLKYYQNALEDGDKTSKSYFSAADIFWYRCKMLINDSPNKILLSLKDEKNLLAFIDETYDLGCEQIRLHINKEAVLEGTGRVSSAYFFKELLTREDLYNNYLKQLKGE